MEVAAYLVDKDKAAFVTVVGRSSTPFAHVFGNIIIIICMLIFYYKIFKNI